MDTTAAISDGHFLYLRKGTVDNRVTEAHHAHCKASISTLGRRPSLVRWCWLAPPLEQAASAGLMLRQTRELPRGLLAYA
jgi:hypothetical protein